MPEPALKCENNAIFNQNYSKKLFISFKISYSCSFGFRGNLEFPEFIHKKFHNINYRKCRDATTLGNNFFLLISLKLAKINLY